MSEQFVNAVYYPSWKVYSGGPPSCLQTERITHVFFAFVRVSPDGTLRYFDEWADRDKEVDGEKGCLAALAKLKREHPHLRVIVSFGGGTGSAEFPELAANETSRATFAREAREFVDKYGFDGIDIDWEHPDSPEQGQDFTSLLQAARSTLPSPTYLLTSALPVGEYCLKHIDLQVASELLDFLNLMGYDLTGSWTDVSGHHAQLLPPAGDVEQVYPTLRKASSSGVEYVLSRGFPSKKLLLGVPAYARYFPQARAPGHPFVGAGEMDYCDMPEEWVCEAQVDEAAAAASFVDPTGDRGFVSFDVPCTVRMKARYATAMGLGDNLNISSSSARDFRKPFVKFLRLIARSPAYATHQPFINSISDKHEFIMGLMWGKRLGGRHVGTSVHVDKHGVRRGPWRFSLGKFSCFKSH